MPIQENTMRRHQAVCLPPMRPYAKRRRKCTPCLNIGFECKTSDKLSRRAFPRGYTESLEEQVRSLEAEVRDLKRLLDEKDEMIDMLSRIRSRSPPIRTSQRTDAPSISPADSTEQAGDDDTFNAIQPAIVDDGLPHTLLLGASSLRPMLRKSGGCIVLLLTICRLPKPKAPGEQNINITDRGNSLSGKVKQ
jgi:hypothetical protein